MPKSIVNLIQPTPSGVKLDLKRLYVYPDGHANLIFADGTNWPLADPYEVVQLLASDLLRPMQKAANALETQPRGIDPGRFDTLDKVEIMQEGMRRRKLETPSTWH
jgi:hypothetical protein